MRNVILLGLIGALLLATATVINGNPPLACSPPCLYYSKTTSIGTIEYQTGANTTAVTLAGKAVAMAADVGDNLIFWSDILLRTISRINLTDGRIDTIVADKLGFCEGLAFEWENKFIYWTDRLYDRIEMARIDGSDRRVLFSTGFDKPRSITLDPRNGLMFWTDWGSKPKIERATLAGQQRTTIVDSTMIRMRWPNDIVIDFTENRIYWLEARHDFIAKADFHGYNRAIIARLQKKNHPFSMTLYNNILFWSDWSSNRSIERLDKVTGTYLGSYGVLASKKVMGITMFDKSRQPKGSQACSNNADCSHLCMIVPGGYNCGCRNGIALKSDGKTCQKGYTNFLLFADRDSQNEKLLQFSLDVPIAIQMPLPITTNVDSPFALDFDPVDGRVYWTDILTDTISRAFLNGSSQEIIIGTDLVAPRGVALDRVGGNIYWTDLGNKNIEVAKMNGSFRRVIALGDKPRDIILDTDKGLMYWTDVGRVPLIEQADMDGENRTILVNSGITLPNSLTLDKTDNRLYWTDGERAAVEYIQIDQGNKRSKLIQNNQALSIPFGLTMLGNYLYYTDWKELTVVRVDKTTKQQEIIVRGLSRPVDIRAFAVNSSQTSGSHPCARSNGGCSYLCLLKPGGFKCACPTNPIPGRPCSPGKKVETPKDSAGRQDDDGTSGLVIGAVAGSVSVLFLLIIGFAVYVLKNNATDRPQVENSVSVKFGPGAETSTSSFSNPRLHDNDRIYDNTVHSSVVAQQEIPAPGCGDASLNPRQPSEYESVNVGAYNNPEGSHYMELTGKRGQHGGFVRPTEYEKPNKTVKKREQGQRNDSNV